LVVTAGVNVGDFIVFEYHLAYGDPTPDIRLLESRRDTEIFSKKGGH